MWFIIYHATWPELWVNINIVQCWCVHLLILKFKVFNALSSLSNSLTFNICDWNSLKPETVQNHPNSVPCNITIILWHQTKLHENQHRFYLFISRKFHFESSKMYFPTFFIHRFQRGGDSLTYGHLTLNRILYKSESSAAPQNKCDP